MGTMTTTLAFCMVATGLHPKTNVLSDKVDLIEINHCYDEKGQLVFDQLLFYDWSPTKCHYDVRDWRLLKNPIQVPRRNHEAGGFVAVWRDGQVMRKVHAETIRESWTQYDPEITEQQFLPKEQRRPFPKLTARRPSTPATPRRCPSEDETAAQPSTVTVLRRCRSAQRAARASVHRPADGRRRCRRQRRERANLPPCRPVTNRERLVACPRLRLRVKRTHPSPS